jgi:uncharacterized membrane protein
MNNFEAGFNAAMTVLGFVSGMTVIMAIIWLCEILYILIKNKLINKK